MRPTDLLLSILILVAPLQAQPGPANVATAPKTDNALPILRVNVTSQPFNFAEPWSKQKPFQRQGLGVLLKDGLILVTAELVANHTYVELELPETAAKSAASVRTVDYDANLALLQPVDPAFTADLPTASLDTGARTGDRVDIVQIETNGTPVITPAVITSTEVGRYPMDDAAFLIFRLSAPLQSRENSFTLPAMRDGRLLGLVMRYDARSQTADLVPAPVIAHFLAAAARPVYDGFPRLGLTYSGTRDPQLRRFLRLPGDRGGVYLTTVLAGSPAEKAGLRPGDVLLSLGGQPVDQDGNYLHPVYGKLSLGHLATTENSSGSILPASVWRDGAAVDLQVELQPRDRSAAISEPYIIDRAPRYLILGGLIFQELSRQYLREWGNAWPREAPLHLVHLDATQNELPHDRGRIVFISGVLPGENTIGYEDLRHEIVTKVNGREIRSLEDLDQAAQQPVDGFIRIELAQDPGLIFLDAAKVQQDGPALQAEYNLPALKHLGP